MLKLSDYFCHLRGKHDIKGLSDPSGVFMKTDRLFMGLEISKYSTKIYLINTGSDLVVFAICKSF